MNSLTLWLRSWRVALRTARREAWRRPPDRRRSLLVAALVGLPVLAASGFVTLVAPGGHGPGRAALLASVPDGAQAVISPVQPGGIVVQNPYGLSVTSEPGTSGQPGSIPEQVPLLRSRLPQRDRLVLGRQAALVALDRASTDRYTVTATTAVEVSAAPEAPASTDPSVAMGLAGVRTGKLVAGRPPATSREVAVNLVLARLLRLSPGGALTLGTPADPVGTARTLTVSGVVDQPDVTLPIVVGVADGLPGFEPTTDPLTDGTQLFVTGPDPVTWPQVQAINQLGWSVLSRQVVATTDESTGSAVLPQFAAPDIGPLEPTQRTRTLLLAELAGLVLLQLVLLAAPAMAVGARRRERSLALAGAAGADPAQVRRIVLALAVWMGTPGAAVGAPVGVGLAATVLLEPWKPTPTPWSGQVPWVAVAGLAAIGVLIAVLAAAIPARASARLDPVAVLHGRRVGSRPRRRTPWVGLALVAAGTTTTLLASTNASLEPLLRAVLAVLGIGLGEIGFLLCLPAVIALGARAADHGPLFVRLALRDADRHRLRTVPAVAAATAAIAGSIAAQMYFDAQDRTMQLLDLGSPPPNALVLRLDSDAPLAPADLERWRGQALRDLTEAGVRDLTPVWTFGPARGMDMMRAHPGANSSPWSLTGTALVPSPTACVLEFADDVVPRQCASAGQRLRRPTLQLGAAVGDARTVRALTGQDLPEATRALASGRAVVTDPELLWPDGTVHVRVWSQTDPPPSIAEFTLPAKVVGSPVLFDAVLPTDVVRRTAPRAYARLHAATVIAEGRGLSRRHPTVELSERLELLAPSASVYGGVDDAWARRLAFLAFAALVTLFGAASAVALAAAEGRADAATLAAVGAAPRTRRRLAAAQALVVAGLGGLGGSASGLLAGWALIQVRATGQEQPGVSVMVDNGPGPQSWRAIAGWGSWEAVPPWTDVAALGVGLPLALAAAAYLLTRSRLPLVRRRT